MIFAAQQFWITARLPSSALDSPLDAWSFAQSTLGPFLNSLRMGVKNEPMDTRMNAPPPHAGFSVDSS
jgi:hypothetical protein